MAILEPGAPCWTGAFFHLYFIRKTVSDCELGSSGDYYDTVNQRSEYISSIRLINSLQSIFVISKNLTKLWRDRNPET